MRPTFVALYFGLVLSGVCYSRTQRKCEDGDPNCLEYDDHYEEAAKEVILDQPNHISFSILNKQAPDRNTNIANTGEKENLTDWWREWYQISLELSQRKPEEHVKPLCKPLETEDSYIECIETSNTHACIGAKNGTIKQCDKYGDTEFLIPICKERSSNRVVTCGALSTFLCYPFEENTLPIKPCHNPFRQICLSRDGSLVKCIQTNFLANLEYLSGLEKESNVQPSWLKEWKRPTPKLEVKDSENESVPLCLMKESNGKVGYCDGKENIRKVCVSVSHGKIEECGRFAVEEVAVPLCSEVLSNRVVVCDRRKEIFLCFSSGEKIKPVIPCDIPDDQICISEDGLLQKCSKTVVSNNSRQTSEEKLTNASNEYSVWNKWWKEWVTGLPVTVEQRDVPLCKPDGQSEKIAICDELSSDAEVCVSAKSGEIEVCKNLSESDLPVPLCKGSRKKVISCNDFGSAFLCVDENVKTKSIRPCRSENRHLCLTDEGLLRQCSDIMSSDDSKDRGYSSASEDDFLYWNRWWEEWFSIRYGLENNLSKGVAVRLCMIKNESLFGCSDDFSTDMACIGAKAGKIGVCEEMQSRDFPIPICREGLTNNVITCGRHTNAFICFSRGKKSSFMKPCSAIERKACIGPDGKVEFCIESASNYAFYRNNGSTEKVNEKHTALWDDWWKEWNSNSWNEESAAIEGKPLCQHDSKKSIVLKCEGEQTKSQLCVSARYWMISKCKSFKVSDQPLSICSDNSSKRIVTCNNITSAFLCAHGWGRSALIFPCSSPSLQICLTEDGLMKICSHKSLELAEGIEMGSTTMPAEYVYAKDRRIEGGKNHELRYVCKPDNSTRLLPCSSEVSHSPACLKTKNGKIQSCQKIERNHAIGVPVCIHVNTSKLITCGKFSKADLCFPRSGKSHPIKPCKKKSRHVCVTEEGKLVKCSTPFKNSTRFSDEDNEYNALIRMEYKYFEYEQENVTSLCIQQDKEVLKECTTDPSINFACLSSKKGIIHSCESGKSNNLSIPLCIRGQTKTVVTCGKFNNVNLCWFPNGKRSTYKPCNINDYFVCLIGGLIGRCEMNNVIYKKHNIYSQGKSGKSYQVSGYQNSKKVYEFESVSILTVLSNCTRLCEVYDMDKEIRSCEEDPFINFACFGVKEGTVKSCKDFSFSDVIMPVCVEKTKEVVTHGKFFKAYLCFQESADGVKIKTCNIRNQQICLTEKGFLEKCNSNEHGTGTEILEDRQNVLTSSPKQSAVTSHSNVNISENLAPTDNKTLEDNLEEMTTDDFSEKVVVLSNKKKFRLLKGKLKFVKVSDQKSKGTKELPGKSAKKEKEQSKNHGDKKIKFLLKDYNSSKKMESDKKSDKVKSKSRAGKSIKNFIKTATNPPSTDEYLNSDEYEQEYDAFDEDLPTIRKRHAVDYSEILDEEILESEYLDYTYIPQQFETNHKEAIEEKELRMIAHIHTISRHLCKTSNESEKLIDCDNDSQLNFACIGIKEGNVGMCHEIAETDIAFPVCFQANSRNLVTCDIFSNVQLCLLEKGNSTLITTCGITNRKACLGEDGIPDECGKDVTRRDTSMLQFKNPDPNDEKFYRLICANCTIENKFILEGNPQDVLPTLEVFTYPPK